MVIRMLSGEMLEWIKRADVWRKDSPLHSWRIPFWIYERTVEVGVNGRPLNGRDDRHYLYFVEFHDGRPMV